MGKQLDINRAALGVALAHANSVPFYADRVPRAAPGIDPWALLQRVPITSRSDVQANRESMLALTGDRREWTVTESTGTTAEPVSVAYDRQARMMEEVILAGLIARAGAADAWQQRGLVHLVLHPSARSRATRVAWSRTATATKWNLIRAWQLNDQAFLNRLHSLNDAVVTGSPSTMELIADRLLAAYNVHGPRPAAVVLSGEVVTSEARRKISKAMGCVVTSAYALGEVGILGTECPQGGYHVEPDVAVVELLDKANRPVAGNVVGAVVVTTLANRAMPLVRYDTGDRACWLGPCLCDHRGPRIQLERARSAQWLITSGGALVHVIRFAKLWRTLQVSQVNLTQRADGAVDVVYRSTRPFTSGQRLVLLAGIRSAIGLGIAVTIRWRPDGSDTAEAPPVGSIIAQPEDAFRAFDLPEKGPQSRAMVEPLPNNPTEVAAWLRQRLSPLPENVEAVLITGSTADPTTSTCFSDIDVTILTRDSAEASDWVSRIRSLRKELPILRVNVDHAAGLMTRSPLVAARMQRERLIVDGAVPAELVGWPDSADVQRDALTWAWQTLPVLWHQLASPIIETEDVLHVAYLAQKAVVNACRYRHVIAGGRTTFADEVIAAELPNLAPTQQVRDATEAISVAREFQPPPVREGASTRYLTAASAVVRSLAVDLTTGSSPRTRPVT